MPFATTGGIDICYERLGSGPRLLFISGTGSDLRIRPNVLDGPFPGDFDMLAYDQRGLGRSSKPAGPYTMTDYAQDATGLMADFRHPPRRDMGEGQSRDLRTTRGDGYSRSLCG